MRNAHPNVIVADDSDASGTVGELLGQYYGMENSEVESRLSGKVLALKKPIDFSGSDKVFDLDGKHGRIMAYYAFWRGEDKAPVRLYKDEGALLTMWMRTGLPSPKHGTVKERDGKIAEAVRGHLNTVNFSTWLPTRIRGLSEDDLSDVVLYPLTTEYLASVSLDSQVEGGKSYLVEQRYIDVHGDWFKFRYRENPGAAFGFMRNVEPKTRSLIFLILTLVAFGVIGVIVFKLPPEARFVNIALAGILAGALGNFINRVQLEYVIDFIDMDLGFYHWPTYNIADIGISCGVIMLLLDMTFNKDSVLAGPKEEAKSKKESQPAKQVPSQESAENSS